MQIPVGSVIVKRRVRVDLGDLASLMRSLQQYGQMNPILLTPHNELIAGHRRLEAAKRLGWTQIEAVVVETHDEAHKLAMELDENVHRKELSPSELLEGYRRLEALLRPGVFTRLRQAVGRVLRRLFRRPGRKAGRPGLPARLPGRPSPDGNGPYGV